jgi:hypothetical protein
MDGVSQGDTSRHSDFAALRHDVLKRFKGASLYKVGREWILGSTIFRKELFRESSFK